MPEFTPEEIVKMVDRLEDQVSKMPEPLMLEVPGLEPFYLERIAEGERRGVRTFVSDSLLLDEAVTFGQIQGQMQRQHQITSWERMRDPRLKGFWVYGWRADA